MTTPLLIATMTHADAHSTNARGNAGSPGPPRKVIELRSWGTLLWALVLFASLFAAQAFLADYLIRADVAVERRWLPVRYAWLDSRAAMTALIGTLGLAIARHNLALGLRPYLSYFNRQPRREDDVPRYAVLLRNEGTGPAVIEQMRYALKFAGDNFESLVEHEFAVARINERCGMVEGVEYKLDRFSRGATLGKDKERAVFELNNDAIERFTVLLRLEIKVRYKGMLGDLYEKTVDCLRPDDYRRPRPLPPAN